MPTVDVGKFEESFVIHFGSEYKRINAYTLATTLVNIADAAKAANSAVNPGYEIAIEVEALGSGSFKAKIRTVYREAGNLFSKESLRTIVLAVIANFVYNKSFSSDPNVIVNVGDVEVTIQLDDKRVIIPRDVHDAMQEVESSPNFRNGVSGAIQAVEADSAITSLALTGDLDDEQPPVEIPRDHYAVLPESLEELEENDFRDISEIATLQISRAILERSRRRWEFVWKGIKISAPVIDDQFYEDFFAHRITIAPGDLLEVRLKIRQRRDPNIDIFINESYEVVEVIKHVPRQSKEKLNL